MIGGGYESWLQEGATAAGEQSPTFTEFFSVPLDFTLALL